MRGRRSIRWALGSALLAGGAFALACSGDATAPAPQLSISPTSAVLVPGEARQFSATGGSGAVTWSSTNPAAATVVEVTGFVEAVAPGTTTIRAESNGRTATASVEVVPPPMIGLSRPMVSFEEVVEGEGDPAVESVSVTNTGGSTLTGLALGQAVDGGGQPVAWLSTALSATTAPATIELSASADGLAAGVYTASVPVTAPGVANSPQSLSVRLTVLAPASIELSVGSVQLGAQPGDESEPLVIDITNGGDAPLTGLAAEVTYPGGAPEGWLSATLAATSAPTTLTLVASTDGLGEGVYNASVILSAGAAAAAPDGPARQVASVEIEVELVVTPGAAIQVSDNDLSFTAVVGEGAPDPQEVAVTNGGGGTLDDLSVGPIDYATTGGWLSVQLGATTAPTVATFTADPSGLAEGTYEASVTIASPVAENSPVTIEVTLTVLSTPTIELSPESLTFAAVHFGSDPSPQTVQVTNGGGGTLSGISGTVSYVGGASGWITGGFSSGTAPSVLTIEPHTGSLPVGVHTAFVTVRSTVPGVAEKVLTVSFEILPSFQADIFPFFGTTYSGFGHTPCTNCHFNGGTAPRLDNAAAAYTALVGAGRVVPGEPSQGVLICKIKGLSGCGTAMRLPAAQVALIEQWILSGANY